MDDLTHARLLTKIKEIRNTADSLYNLVEFVVKCSEVGEEELVRQGRFHIEGRVKQLEGKCRELMELVRKWEKYLER